ncbi:MAG: hypothetical protein JNL38_09620, partial [Myxococcales bacterium]|nr:hypothetical protein [Myxococcales bacterium]
DRAAARWSTPETGGPPRPRFVTARQLAALARIEAVLEGESEPSERFVRVALERRIAEDMLSALLLRRGPEPVTIPALAEEARLELCARVGGCDALSALLAKERLTVADLAPIFVARARSLEYVERALTPIMRPSEEELREAFRTAQHPFREKRFEEVKGELARWLVHERLRVAETEYFQNARGRVRLVGLASHATAAR